MDNRSIEDREQAAYQKGVLEGREEGFLEGMSTTLHRLGQMQSRMASADARSAAQMGANVVLLKR